MKSIMLPCLFAIILFVLLALPSQAQYYPSARPYSPQYQPRDLTMERAMQGDAMAMYSIGLRYDLQKNYNEAYRWYEASCRLGNPQAYYAIAILLRDGKGTPVDLELANRFFVGCAQVSDGQILTTANTGRYPQGYESVFRPQDIRLMKECRANAMNYLGDSYRAGRYGLPKNYEQAEYWYKLAKANGNTAASFSLITLESEKRAQQAPAPRQNVAQQTPKTGGDQEIEDWINKGIKYLDEENYTEAVKWFRKAAEKGDARAQFNIGALYWNGYGLKKDYGEAYIWFYKAADQGLLPAMVYLGYCYALGYGIEKDYEKAYLLIKKAKENGEKVDEELFETLIRLHENRQMLLEKGETEIVRNMDRIERKRVK